MCGVFGFISNDTRALHEATKILHKGMELISHRGPDGSGTWVSKDGRVGLGHLRLSIIDIERGVQPMVTEDSRYVIIFNGEIYNYIEIRNEIGFEKFETHSDTEVLLKAYQTWGIEFLSHLRGMYSFIIWDSLQEKILLARDRFGIKPLYWVRTSRGIFFASEIKAMLPFMDSVALNRRGFSDYVSFQYCIGNQTLIDGVFQLPAAHYSLFSYDCEVKTNCYWEVHYNIDYDHTEVWFKERLRELIQDSIKIHLRSDVEVGSYVSGGMDSSFLAAYANRFNPDRGMKIFNGRFTDGPDFDESEYARDIAALEKMKLYIKDIDENDFINNIENIIWYLDQPTAGPGAFPQFMISKEVSKHVKVVIGGQGGDEIFGGYARYLLAYFEQCIKGAIDGSLYSGNFVVSYESIIPNLESLRQYKPMLKDFWADGLFDARDERYWRLINKANSLNGIIDPEFMDQSKSLESFKKIFWGENVNKESYFDSMTHFDFKTLLPALLHVEDRMSMAHGIEARLPFLDHPLVEFLATVPADIKFQNGELKRFLKLISNDFLPLSIRERKDKMGFPVPLNLWVKRGGVVRDYVGDLLGSSKARTRPYLLPGLSVDKILNSESMYGRNLWALLSLEIWHCKFIDLN